MSQLISVLVGIFTYIVIFKLLFADLNDFSTRLKKTSYYLPLAILLDEFLDWNQSFLKKCLRILLWLPSGIVVGTIVYKFLN
jgi:hypothetical protein